MIDKRLAENNIEMEAYDVPISPHQQAATQNANKGTLRLAVQELRNITMVDLTIKATNYFEKLVWICMTKLLMLLLKHYLIFWIVQMNMEPSV